MTKNFHSDRRSADHFRAWKHYGMASFPHDKQLLKLPVTDTTTAGCLGLKAPITMWEINLPLCLGQNASLYQVILF